MKVTLISHSQALSSKAYDQGWMGIEDMIAYCARVSNPSNQNNRETSHKLLRYLIKHKHWSPFEMVSICLEIETTRDIGRQILRHRSFSFQEFSQRYADPTKDLDFETRKASCLLVSSCSASATRMFLPSITSSGDWLIF